MLAAPLTPDGKRGRCYIVSYYWEIITDTCELALNLARGKSKNSDIRKIVS